MTRLDHSENCRLTWEKSMEPRSGLPIRNRATELNFVLGMRS
jgi:hypothetical protein